ncbi:MAG TPA: beta-propeller fold lactonase family protein [Bryobacteraceae bacterium]|jgi:6-phosphogluconolactonase (cycloisomerase 2 family)|nr:beta-propeller fold lactonase family protein [Bryobacteraceae bacterium]
MRLFVRKCRPANLKAVVLVVAGCAGAFGQVNVYVPDFTASPNAVMSEFTITSTGALSVVNVGLTTNPCASVPVGGTTTINGQTYYNAPPCQGIQQTDANPTRVAMTPDNRFLYVPSNTGSIDAYTVSAGGFLTPIALGATAYVAPGGPLGIAVNQKNVYVALNGGNAIGIWSINQSSGALTPVTCAPCSLAAGSSPTNLAIDPTGSYVYVALPGTHSIGVGTVNPGTGAFSSFAVAYTGTATFNPQDLVLSPAGNLLFAVDNGTPGNVYAFPVSGATLGTPVTASTGGLNPQGIAIDPSGTFVFASNYATSNIAAFKISTSPLALTPAPGSPFASGGSGLQGISVAPTGNYVYVSNYSSGSVTAFTFDTTTGALTNNGTVATQTGPRYLLAHLVPPLTTAVPAASTWSLAALGLLLAGLSAMLYRKAYR